MSAPFLGLRARNLVVSAGRDRLVDGVDLSVPLHGAVGIAGESGSGKSLLSQALLGVLPEDLAWSADALTWRDESRELDLVALPPRERRKAVGELFGFAWQDPASALNPVLTVGAQLVETLRSGGVDKARARDEAIERLSKAGLAEAATVASRLPHELSGGMRQRVMMALALARDPRLLIADEPTTALDATTRLRMLRGLRDERDARGLTVVVISHDLDVIAGLCDELHVMYSGRVVESGRTVEVLHAPRHPYAIGLARAGEGRIGAGFVGIEGAIPAPGERPSGCRFRDRCPYARPACAEAEPALVEADAGHGVACDPALEGKVPPGVWPREAAP